MPEKIFPGKVVPAGRKQYLCGPARKAGANPQGAGGKAGAKIIFTFPLRYRRQALPLHPGSQKGGGTNRNESGMRRTYVRASLRDRPGGRFFERMEIEGAGPAEVPGKQGGRPGNGSSAANVIYNGEFDPGSG